MRFPSLAGISDAFFAAFRRFPLSMLIALVGTVSVIAFVYAEDLYADENTLWLIKLWMCCMLGLPLLTAIAVWGESGQKDRNIQWAAFGVGVLLLGLFYWTMAGIKVEDRQVVRFMGLLAGAHLLVSFAPYLNPRPVSDFWEYNKRLFSTFVAGGFYAFLLFLGLSGAILATDQLFDLDLSEKIYFYLFAVLMGVVNTTFFLYHFPKQYDLAVRDISNQAITLLCKYILIPITALYFLILYLFSAKILITWSLPKGWVSSLVIGFASVGIFTWLLNFLPGREQAAGVHRAFARWFWPVLAPMLVLLFVGIGYRINAYGVTPGRFVVAHLGLWLALCAGYFLISKKDNIKFVPISLAFFIVVALYGPLSMYSVSNRSQLGQLEQLLTPFDRWSNGQIKPSDQPMDPESSARVGSILLELSEYQDFKQGKPEWLAAVPDSLLNTTPYGIANAVGLWLRIDKQSDEALSRYIGSQLFPIGHPIPAGFNWSFTLYMDADGGASFDTFDGRDTLQFRSLVVDTTGSFILLRDPKGVEMDRYPLGAPLADWKAKTEDVFHPGESWRVRGRQSELLLIPHSATFKTAEKTIRLERIEATGLVKINK